MLQTKGSSANEYQMTDTWKVVYSWHPLFKAETCTCPSQMKAERIEVVLVQVFSSHPNVMPSPRLTSDLEFHLAWKWHLKSPFLANGLICTYSELSWERLSRGTIQTNILHLTYLLPKVTFQQKHRNNASKAKSSTPKLCPSHIMPAWTLFSGCAGIVCYDVLNWHHGACPV